MPANASGEHRLPLETRRFDRNAVCPNPSSHFASPWKSRDTLQSIARGFDLLTQQLFDVIEVQAGCGFVEQVQGFPSLPFA